MDWARLEYFGLVRTCLLSIDYDWVIETWVKSAYVNQAIGGDGVCVGGGLRGSCWLKWNVSGTFVLVVRNFGVVSRH